MRWMFLPVLLIVSLAVGGWFAWSWYQSSHVRRVLVMGTGPADSEYYAFGRAFARMVAQRLPRMEIRVIETFGSQENFTLLADGTYDLALMSADAALTPEMRVVDFLFPELYHLVARQGAGISQVGDLKGKVVGLMPEGSGSRPLFWHLLHHYGVSPSDINTVSLLSEGAATELNRGAIDAYFRLTALGSTGIEHLLETSPVDLVAIDQAAALKLSQPSVDPGVIPKGAYDGGRPIPPNDLPVVSVRTLLIARADVSSEDVYDLVNVLHETRNELASEDRRVALIQPVSSPFTQGVALHPGTRDYYSRDEPLFIVQYAETMGFIMSVSIFVLSGLWHLKVRAEMKSKNRADVYNTRLIRLAEQAQDAKSLQQVQNIRTELFTIFPRLFEDLDNDRVSQTSIQGITLACYVVTQVIQARESYLAERTHSVRPFPAASNQ